MKYRNIVFVTPEPIKNMGNFRNYLIENTESLITFHFFHGYSDEKSYMEKFHNGRMIFRVEFPVFSPKINIIRTIIYRIYLEYILLRYANRGSFVIVEKPFFIIFSGITSFLKNLKFIFWIGDYYPDSKGFMRIYNYLVDYYNRNLKYVLYESPPIKKIYAPMTNDPKNKYRALVTLGMSGENFKIKNKPGKEIRLGFIGVLRPMQGLDLIFNYLSKTKEKVRLEIIGSGYYLEHYKKLAEKKRITEKIKFYGFIENTKHIMSNWDIGFALYENKKENLSIYCEPTKIKDYLEHGLPVITTKATYFYRDLVEQSAGEATDETIVSLEEAVKKIKNNYDKYLIGVEKILNKYEYKKWYDKRFRFLKAI